MSTPAALNIQQAVATIAGVCAGAFLVVLVTVSMITGKACRRGRNRGPR